MLENVDFEFLDNETKNYPTTPMKILTGKFKDVIVCYGKVKIEETSSEFGTLKFTFKIVSDHKQYDEDEEFKDHIARILHQVILDSMGINEPTEEYFEEPN